MASPGEGPDRSDPAIEDFLDDPTRDPLDWRWLWETDEPFPLRGRPGFLGRLILVFKKILRPFVRVPAADLWDRQRAYNLILLEYIQQHGIQITERDRRIQDLLERGETRDQRLDHLDAFLDEGLKELMAFSDALYSRVDQKLDRYRREAATVGQRFASALEATATAVNDRPDSEAPDGPHRPTPSRQALQRAVSEDDYQRLEDLYRGTTVEIAERTRFYLPFLEGRRQVIDLGCGRGEALSVLKEGGIGARGVDSSEEAVRVCTSLGLEAAYGDVFEYLAGLSADSVDGVVSFHVIEHLPAERIAGLLRLAWRALEPGGRLILETPNPLSVVVAASHFWRDPTHLRPIHPDALVLACELAGFDSVERRFLRRFESQDSLPEIDPELLEARDRPLADAVNRLRDRLDDTLFGYQDYAVIATKSTDVNSSAGS